MKRDDRPIIIAWIVFILLASGLAFHMMRRDADQGFGGFAYGGVPYFQLAEIGGEDRSLHQLKGRVWLLNFVSPNRAEPHTETIAALKGLYQRFSDRGNFEIVTVSTNQKHLTDMYQRLKGEEQSRWHLLHGSREEIARLMRDGFALDQDQDLFHIDQRIFLIDQNATIRGFYKIDTQKQVPAIERHLSSLL